MEDRKNPQIVAVPLNGQGHISPMMHLCSYLAEHGFSVIFALTEDPRRIQYHLVKRGAWPPPGMDITIIELHTDIPYPQSGFNEYTVQDLTAVSEHLRNYAASLEELVKKIRCVSCIISDYQQPWVIDTAVKLGVPSAILFTGSATWSWFELQMPRLVSSGLVPMQQSYELPEEQDSVVLEDPKLLRSDIPRHYWNNKRWQEFATTYNSTSFGKATWVLSSSCEELESDMIRIMKASVGEKFIPIGPIFLLNKDPCSVGCLAFDSECLKWLDRQPIRSVLYISFGSLARLPLKQVEELAKAIEASQQRFLWVTRWRCEGKGFKVEVETSQFFEEFASEISSDQGLVVSWAPQAEVLAHPAVGAFLTHCGWNSTVESVVNGQPMICFPCVFEQHMNYKIIVERWNVGVGLKKTGNLVDAEEIERVVRMVMEGDEGHQIRRRAQELSVEVKNARSSLTNLEVFCKRISEPHTTDYEKVRCVNEELQEANGERIEALENLVVA